jgi:hypothetical protein
MTLERRHEITVAMTKVDSWPASAWVKHIVRDMYQELLNVEEGPGGLSSHKHRVKMYLAIIEKQEEEIKKLKLVGML